MNRRLTCTLTSSLLLCTVLFASGAESIIFTPSVMLSAGAEGNRYHTADDQQSEFFMDASPALSLLWFATEQADMEIGASFLQRSYTSDAGEQQSPSLSAGIHYRLGSLQLAATTSAGTFQDSVLPDDDALWMQSTLAAGFNFRSGQQIYLRSSYHRRDYDSRMTLAGEDQTADITGLIAGFFTPLADRMTCWTELQQTRIAANEPLDEASEIAIAAGVGFRTSARGNLDISFKYATATTPDDDGVDADTRPWTVALGYSHRLTDWCSWQNSMRWEQVADGRDLYDEWSIVTAISLAIDL
ncbi:MAG TPA: hypothetical protein DCS43_15560 [Verrucomicrobia bacterium]|nr:hypothetical protein [Verrucomicrobiota bacterium]